jgi:hypothetical protein
MTIHAKQSWDDQTHTAPAVLVVLREHVVHREHQALGIQNQGVCMTYNSLIISMVWSCETKCDPQMHARCKRSWVDKNKKPQRRNVRVTIHL